MSNEELRERIAETDRQIAEIEAENIRLRELNHRRELELAVMRKHAELGKLAEIEVADAYEFKDVPGLDVWG